MINFKKLFETVYEPRSGDEKNFKDKHVIMKIKYPVDTESQFTSDKPKAKRKADYDTKDDEAVYEAAEVHTKRADKEPVIVRTIDPKTGQGKAKTVLKRAGEIKVEEADLDEKVVNPYAVGMAAAMKATGDRPPLKKSTIMKGHEIAKGIKKEAMDPVGKEDGDIDNDGDVDKSDKYLKNRRKAIGRAMQKEDASSDQENSSYTIYKKSNKPNPIKKNAEDAVKEAVELDELDKKTLGSYIKKASQSRGVAGIVAGSSAHKSKDQKDALKVMKKRMTGISRATDRLTKEEVDQLDELSPNTLHKYIKKATPEVAARAISAVAPNQSAETKKHASKLGKRIAGITSASGRLSDKANQYEEVDQIDELSKKTLGSYVKKAKDDYGFSNRWIGRDSRDKDAKQAAAKRSVGIDRAVNRLTKEEVEMIDEAVKIGAMKLHDGSTVNVTREMADSLNGVFEQLNPMNRVKMEQKLHTSKKDFEEILKFAETVNG